MLECLLSSVVRKMTAYPGCAGLARSPFVLTEHISSYRYSTWKCGIFIIGERAKRARHYQGCTNSSWCGIYIYICMEVRMPY